VFKFNLLSLKKINFYIPNNYCMCNVYVVCVCVCVCCERASAPFNKPCIVQTIVPNLKFNNKYTIVYHVFSIMVYQVYLWYKITYYVLHLLNMLFMYLQIVIKHLNYVIVVKLSINYNLLSCINIL